MANRPHARLSDKQLLLKPACELFNLYRRWEEIALAIVSCQLNDRIWKNLLWERSLK